jgi:hypothetical protein
MPLLGSALVGSSPHLWDPNRQERRGHTVVRCDFCGSATARWHYSASDGHSWRACQTCHRTIEADDREALVERVVLSNRRIKLPGRPAWRSRRRSRALQEDFWLKRIGTAEAL